MNRLGVIQSVINRKDNVKYLEIGVNDGRVFLKVKAHRKIAVDPMFQIPRADKLRYGLRNPTNIRNRYFKMTSNTFFENHADALKKGIDVAFIDGLHTHEQSFCDVVNCLGFLNPDGVIIMHDCLPPNAAACQKANSPEEAILLEHPGWTNEWTGDVYKALLQLRVTRNDLDIFVVDADYGLGVIRKGAPSESINLTMNEVKNLSFDDFYAQREKWPPKLGQHAKCIFC
ncbi:class I SAM-dependent methyltransferase [Pseudomonadota bacterium]